MQSRLVNPEKINFSEYIDEYLKQPDAIQFIPTDEELIALAHKTITRDYITLEPLSEGETAKEGDVATLTVASNLPRYNKEKVTMTLGQGLYNKELEMLLVGHSCGDTIETEIQGETVKATILELKRKKCPEPTDAMVQAMQVKGLSDEPITTVAGYEELISTTELMTALSTISSGVLGIIYANGNECIYSEEDIVQLGKLEKVNLIDMFKQDGVDILKEVPAGWKENGIYSIDDFIQSRYEEYKSKLRKCLILLNIMDLPCQGQTDPLENYDILFELQADLMEFTYKELEKRNKQ